jgi:hypothetical protein
LFFVAFCMRLHPRHAGNHRNVEYNDFEGTLPCTLTSGLQFLWAKTRGWETRLRLNMTNGNVYWADCCHSICSVALFRAISICRRASCTCMSTFFLREGCGFHSKNQRRLQTCRKQLLLWSLASLCISFALTGFTVSRATKNPMDVWPGP